MNSIDWPTAANIAMPVIALLIGAGFGPLFSKKRSRVISYLGHVSGISLSRPEGRWS